LGGETLQVRRVVEVVERVALRLAGGIGEEGHRGIHDPEVIHEDDDEVRFVGGEGLRSEEDEEETRGEEGRSGVRGSRGRGLASRA